MFPFLLCLLLLFVFWLFVRPPHKTILLFCISFSCGWFDHCLLYNVKNLHGSSGTLSIRSNSLNLWVHMHSVQLVSSVAQSCLTLCDPIDCSPPGSSVHEDSPVKNTGVCCHVLLQGIFPTQGLNLDPPNCGQILYLLGYQGSPTQGIRSDQISHSVMSDSLQPHESQHARPPCPSPTPGVHPYSRPSSRWCHPAISSAVVLFSSCPQSLPASESFPVSQLFAWGSQSTGVSALASVLPKNTQDRSPLEWTGWISLQSKGLSRVFSNITVQKHQFFVAQPSLWSKSHIHTWLWENRSLD